MTNKVVGIFDQMRERRMNEEAESKSEFLVETKGPEEEPKKQEGTEPEVEPETPEVEPEVEPTVEPAVEPETPEVEPEVSEELNEAKKVVVRDGERTVINKPTHKKRITSAQKAALAKARKKAHTAAADKARKKSMKKRSAMGLDSEDTMTCPECGFEGDEDEFEEEDGILYCPECGASCENVQEGCGDHDEEDDEEDDVNEAELDVKKTAVNGKSVTIWINGKKYSYFPKEETGLKATEVADKFLAIAKHNVGRALAYVKKNCTTSDSYRKNEEVDVAELAVRLDECDGSEYMKKALNEGKYDMVRKYLAIKEGE